MIRFHITMCFTSNKEIKNNIFVLQRAEIVHGIHTIQKCLKPYSIEDDSMEISFFFFLVFQIRTKLEKAIATRANAAP